MFGRSEIGSRFSAVLTTAYEGRSLTTDVEFDVVSALGCDVVAGSDWLAAWRQVGREDLPGAANVERMRVDEIDRECTLFCSIFLWYLMSVC